MTLAGAALAALMFGGSAATQRQAEAADAMAADDPKTWKTILTDKDLEQILKLQVDVIKENTKSSGIFLRGFRKVQGAAHIVAAVGNIGAMTQEGDAAKKSAALREAGLALAAAAKKKAFADVAKPLAAISAYPDSIEPAADAKPAKWDVVLPLDNLMKTVNAIDSATAGAVRKDEKAFKKDSKKLSTDSTLMAVLGVVAREHNANADWKGWCDDMREGSLKMAKEFSKGSLASTKEARNELQKSCTNCHDVYRKEE
jgi:hypothetical protein